jgi:integrase
MAIRNKGTKFQVDVTWKGVRAPRVTVATFEEAHQIETDFKASLMAGIMPCAPSQNRSGPVKKTGVSTITQLAHYCVMHHWRGKKSEASSERNAHAWVDALGPDFPTAKLNRQVIDQIVSGWAEEVKTGTINRKIAALSVMLRIAKEQGALSHDFKVKQKKEYKGRIRWFSEDEIASMEQFFSDDRDFLDLFILALDTGFRFGELIKITPRDWNPSTGKLSTWVTKGDEPRSVPLTPRAREIVLRRRSDVRDWELLFPPTVNSSSVSRRLRAWKAWAKLPGDDEAVFHSFRHTCCSRLVQAGVSLAVVQKWMGHATIQTTMRYAHLAPNAFDDALEALTAN